MAIAHALLDIRGNRGAGTIDTDDPILRARVTGLKRKRDEAPSFVRMLGVHDGSKDLN